MIKAIFFDYNGTCTDLRGMDKRKFRFAHEPYKSLDEQLDDDTVQELICAKIWTDFAWLWTMSSEIDLCILTNNSDRMMEMQKSNVQLGRVQIDPRIWIRTADMVSKFKPDPYVYIRACQDFAVTPEESLMVAAHNFDLIAAAKVGMKTCFIDRPGEDNLAGIYDYHIKSFEELVTIIRSQ